MDLARSFLLSSNNLNTWPLDGLLAKATCAINKARVRVRLTRENCPKSSSSSRAEALGMTFQLIACADQMGVCEARARFSLKEIGVLSWAELRSV